MNKYTLLNNQHGTLSLLDMADRCKVINYLNSNYSEIDEKLINKYITKFSRYYYINTPNWGTEL